MSELVGAEKIAFDMKINMSMTPKFYMVREADVGLDINVLAEEVSLEQYNENKESLTKFAMEGFSDRRFTLTQIDELLYNEIQNLRLYGVQIRAYINGTEFIIGYPANLTHEGLIHNLEPFGDNVKFNLVLGEFNRVSMPERIDVTKKAQELKLQAQINKSISTDFRKKD